MTDPRLITDEELAALRRWHRDAGVATPWSTVQRILARNPAPWEPSEDDITAYCEAMGWPSVDGNSRNVARHVLTWARKRGWDATPRRLAPEEDT